MLLILRIIMVVLLVFLMVCFGILIGVIMLCLSMLVGLFLKMLILMVGFFFFVGGDDFNEGFDWVEIGVFGEGFWDDFEGFGKGFDGELFFVVDFFCVFVEFDGEFDFWSIIGGDDFVVFDDVFDDFDGVFKGFFDFINDVFGVVFDEYCDGFWVFVVFDEDYVFVGDFFLFDEFGFIEVFWSEVVDVGDDFGVGGFGEFFYVVFFDFFNGYYVVFGKVVLGEVVNVFLDEDDICVDFFDC